MPIMQDEESINHYFIHLRMRQSFDTIFFFFRNMALYSAFLAQFDKQMSISLVWFANVEV